MTRRILQHTPDKSIDSKKSPDFGRINRASFSRTAGLAGILLLACNFVFSQTTVNAYARITSVTSSSVLALSDVNIASHTFSVGGRVIVMQMQDNVIGTNTTNVSTFGNLSAISNAGNYEIRTITAITPTTGTPTSVTITPALGNTYNTGANSMVQLISFRDLGANYTTTANISGPAWNGTVGGVVAFYVTNTLTLNHRILADGLGFRGGSFSNNNSGPVCTAPSNTIYTANNNQLGFKGEGIYRATDNTFNNARGRLLNGGGGGNDHNAGGGGGGNFTAGGQGGNGYNNCTTFPGGGLGGLSLSAQISASRVFMGGGGGGGQQNNSQNSAGGNGGGIILISANVIASSTTCASSIRISANGNTAINAGNDGMGGGGAGGSIVLQVNSYSITATCPLTVSANGGNGGSVTDGAAHGGGGGGGQGVIIYSIPQPTVNITTQVNNGSAGADNSGGSTSAAAGTGTSGTGVVASSSGPMPVELFRFDAKPEGEAVVLNWLTTSELNNSYFSVERSSDGVTYSEIKRVKGAGTKKTPTAYKAFDNQPLHGTTYYRLKQVDFDDSYDYSKPVSVEYKKPLEVALSPNPVNSGEEITLLVANPHFYKTIEITLQDITGHELMKQAHNLTDTGLFKMVCPPLVKGVYLVRIQAGNLYLVKKLLVN